MFVRVVLGVLVLVAAGTEARGQVVNAPARPSMFVDTAYPSCSGTVRYVRATDCGALSPCSTGDAGVQTQLDLLVAGDTLDLEGGATFTGNYYLPDLTDDPDADAPWTCIVSSTLANLPPGRRVKVADEVHMAKLVSNSTSNPHNGAVITVVNGADHYRFAGISFSTGLAMTTLLQMGGNVMNDARDTRAAPTTELEMAHHIVFDRSLVYSTSESNNLTVGINMTGWYMGVIDSRIYNIKATQDAQAVIVWYAGATATTSGPFLFANNYLEATGENIMFGGAGIKITNSIPQDIQIYRNHFFKPYKWNANHADFNDQPTAAGWLVKNLLEFKNAKIIDAQGNIFENSFPGGQTGRAVLISPRNDAGTANWVTVRDLTFNYNLIHESTMGFSITGADGNATSDQTQRIEICHNVVEDINERSTGSGRFADVGTPVYDPISPIEDFLLCNNLYMAANDELGNAFIAFNANDRIIVDQASWIDNIVDHAEFGSLNHAIVMSNETYTSNMFVFNDDFSEDNTAETNFSTGLPSGNIKESRHEDVLFVDESQWMLDGGDYTLQAGSNGKAAGTDGEDMGPNIALVKEAIGCTIEGNCGTTGATGAPRMRGRGR